jgi:gliding motility-associated-like protein
LLLGLALPLGGQAQFAQKTTPQGITFLEYLPTGYSPQAARKYPLIIYLHDHEARGDNGHNIGRIADSGPLSEVKNGRPLRFTVNGTTEQLMVLAPQMNSSRFDFNDILHPFYDFAVANYQVDPSRVYVVGHNLGGYGALATTSARPERFAAIVALSPNSAPANTQPCSIALAKTSLWAFHGAADGLVQPWVTDHWVTQYNACQPAPATQARLTMLPGLNNAQAIATVYRTDNPAATNIYQWLLAQRRPLDQRVTGPAPTISLPAELRVTLPQTNVVIDASRSQAAPGSTIVGWLWRQVGGYPLALSNFYSNRLTVGGFGADGQFILELIAIDDQGRRASQQIRLVARQTPPCPYCDFVVGPNQPVADGRNLGVQPGDTVCVRAGLYRNLAFRNFQGAPGKPITVINCGGQVVIGRDPASNYGWSISDSEHFKITGTGDAAHRYGFWLDQVGSPANGASGLAIGGHSSDFEVEFVEVGHTAYAGVMAKADPNCGEPQNWAGNLTMRNLSFHDLYIHDTKTGEGFYIGNTGNGVDCNGAHHDPHFLENVSVYNNRIERTGRDLIQVSRTVSGMKVYNNVCRDFGTANLQWQNFGIIIGSHTNGEVYNNRVIGGTGGLFQFFGSGLKLYNNLFADCPYGLYLNDRGSLNPTTIQIYNNTIVANDAGIMIEGTGTKGNRVYNNVLVIPGNSVVSKASGTDMAETNNLKVKTLAQAGFVDPAKQDFRLLGTSAAVDQGAEAQGLLTDLAGQRRPQGRAIDIGAYEWTVTPGAQVVKVEAGPDRVVHLPLNGPVELAGSATATPGTVSRYAWSQVSGPSQAQLSNANTATATGQGFGAGRYVFKLEATGSLGATGSAQVAIRFNQRPSISGLTNQTITQPASAITLAATATDADGSLATYRWEQVSGPAPATLNGAATARLSVTALAAVGTYTFRLTVTDNDGGTTTATVTVQVVAQNQTPPAAGLVVAKLANRLRYLEYLPQGYAEAANRDRRYPIIFYFHDTPQRGNTEAELSKISQMGPLAEVLAGKNLQFTVNGTEHRLIVVAVQLSTSTPNFEPIFEEFYQFIVNNYRVDTERIYLTGHNMGGGSALGIASQNPGRYAAIAPVPSRSFPLNDQPERIGRANLPVRFYHGTQDAVVRDFCSDMWAERINAAKPAVATVVTKFTGLDNASATQRAYRADNQADTPNLYQWLLQYRRAANAAPTVSAGANRVDHLPLANGSLTLTGQATDADGSIATWAWSQVSGPNAAQLAGASTASLVARGLVAGSYTFRLTVTDNLGATSTAEVTVKLNQRPSITGLANQTVTRPASTATLAATITDADGSLAGIRWEQTGGPAQVTLTGASTARVTLAGLTIAGTYTFRVTATDNDGGSGTATVSVQVLAAPAATPASILFWSPTVVRLPLEQANVLAVVNGLQPARIIWAQEGGPGPAALVNTNTLNLGVRNLQNGTYIFRLTVTDANGQTLSRTVNLHVMAHVGVARLRLTYGGAPVAELRSTFTIEQGSPQLDMTRLNIVASTFGYVGSIRYMVHNDQCNLINATASGPDFSLFGAGTTWNLAPGNYTLIAIPYSGLNLTGMEGEPFVLRFNVRQVTEGTAPAVGSSQPGPAATRLEEAAPGQSSAPAHSFGLDIPQVVSPNHDGINDQWQIKGLESHPGATLRVFDAAGREVFQANDYQGNWDGTLRGAPLPADAYHYLLYLPQANHLLKGVVSIVR